MRSGAAIPPPSSLSNGLEALRGRVLLAAARQSAPLASEASPAEETGTPPHLVQAYACLIGGTGATLVAIAAGAENLVNTIAGGVVATQNRAVLILGVAGIVFTSFCALGQALTPVYLYYTEPAPSGDAPPAGPRQAAQPRSAAWGATPTRVTFQAGIFGGTATGAARRIGNEPTIAARSVFNELAQLPAARGR